MKTHEFWQLRQQVVDAGYGEEIVWQETVKEPDTADEFMGQYIWVVLSSGIKNQIARIIEQRIIDAYSKGKPLSSVFKHEGKVKAIENMIDNHDDLFDQYLNSNDKLTFLKSLPYIGDITKYHLAKNLGEDIAKPDRHLVRIAGKYGETTQSLCERLAKETGYRVATVDLIIWRAANLGMI